METRDLQTEQIVAGRDPRAAHGRHLRRASAGQALFPHLAQQRRRQEAPVSAEIGRKRMIHGARDVTGDRVDRLDCPGIAFAGTGIDQ